MKLTLQELSKGLIVQPKERLKTPEQQADYLIEIFGNGFHAKICCDEIIKELERIVYPNPDRVKYWQQVSDSIPKQNYSP